MTSFFANVTDWATKRNIPKGSTAKKQRGKTYEELGELAEAIAKSNTDKLKDGIGDCAVTTVNTALCMGFDVEKLGQQAAGNAELARITGANLDNDDILNDFVLATAKLGIERGKGNTGVELAEVSDSYALLVQAIVSLDLLAGRFGLTFEECQDFAWDEIKDRKGMAINQVFVKEADVNGSVHSLLGREVAFVIAADPYDPETHDSHDIWMADVAQIVGKRIRGYFDGLDGVISVSSRLDDLYYVSMLWSCAGLVGECRVNYVTPGTHTERPTVDGTKHPGITNTPITGYRISSNELGIVVMPGVRLDPVDVYAIPGFDWKTTSIGG